MKKIAKGHLRQHGVNYHTLSEDEVINWIIPADATINPNIGGKRAVVFEVQLKTHAAEPNRFKFTCFSNTWQPGDSVTGKLKLGHRQVMNHQPLMYARLDEVSDTKPTALLELIDNQSVFERKQADPKIQTFPFPRKSQIGGAVLQSITKP